MNKIKKAAWNTFFIICTAIIISMIVSKLLTGWSSIFSYRIFYILSESMESQISVKQLVVGEYIPEDEELEIGKIYAYRREGVIGQEIVIHRLIAVTEDGRYQFKGDNNELPDNDVVEREKIGYRIEWY